MREGRSSAHGEGDHRINPLLIVLSCINDFRQVQKSVTMISVHGSGDC